MFQAEHCGNICREAYLIISPRQDAGPSVLVLHIVDALDIQLRLEHFMFISASVRFIVLHASTSLDVWRLAMYI